MKFWMIVVMWLLFWELSALRSRYYNCLFLWTQTSLSVVLLKGNGNLIKNLPTNEGDWERKPGDHWEHPSPVGKLMSLKGSCRWWKTSQPMRETGEENRTRDQSIKNFSTRWGEDWGGKPKDHKCRYCQWKNLPTWTKDRKGKNEVDGERMSLFQGLFEEELGW